MLISRIARTLGKTTIVLLLILITLLVVMMYQDYPDQVSSCLVTVSNRCYASIEIPNE